MNKYLMLIAISIMSSLQSVAFANEEVVLGKWCFISEADVYREIITIRKNSSGTYEAYSEYNDGSNNTNTLVEHNNGELLQIKGSSAGDAYKIVSSVGKLVLSDYEGYIGTATLINEQGCF